MLALIIVQLLSAPVSCQARCGTDNERCYSRCSPGQPNCNRHCDDLTNSCNAQCAAANARAESATQFKGSPCPTSAAAKVDRNSSGPPLRPCTETELKEQKALMNSPEVKKGLKCKDKEGNPTPCEDDVKKAADLYDQLGGQKALCTDKQGNPTVCADAMKKTEDTFKKKP